MDTLERAKRGMGRALAWGSIVCGGVAMGGMASAETPTLTGPLGVAKASGVAPTCPTGATFVQDGLGTTDACLTEANVYCWMGSLNVDASGDQDVCPAFFQNPAYAPCTGPGLTRVVRHGIDLCRTLTPATCAKGVALPQSGRDVCVPAVTCPAMALQADADGDADACFDAAMPTCTGSTTPTPVSSGVRLEVDYCRGLGVPGCAPAADAKADLCVQRTVIMGHDTTMATPPQCTRAEKLIVRRGGDICRSAKVVAPECPAGFRVRTLAGTDGCVR